MSGSGVRISRSLLTAQTGLTVSLQLEEAGRVSIMRKAGDILFAFLFQIFIFQVRHCATHSKLSVVVWCVRRCPGCGAWWAPVWWRGPCWCPAPGSSCPAPAPSPAAATSQARPSSSRGCKADAENKFFGGCIHTQNIYLYLLYINFITHIDR